VVGLEWTLLKDLEFKDCFQRFYKLFFYMNSDIMNVFNSVL
jgi:hypothetical protein